LDVSAYRRALNRRPGLSQAVQLIEAGQAQVVVARVPEADEDRQRSTRARPDGLLRGPVVGADVVDLPGRRDLLWFAPFRWPSCTMTGSFPS
jgi:hypothetical protein